MAERTYENPRVLGAMVSNQHWPRSVTYRDDGTAVVECGQWGSEGWIRFTETFPASDMPEAEVASKFRLKESQSNG